MKENTSPLRTVSSGAVMIHAAVAPERSAVLVSVSNGPIQPMTVEPNSCTMRGAVRPSPFQGMESRVEREECGDVHEGYLDLGSGRWR